MASTAFPSRDDFAAMLNQSLGGENEGFEGRVVKGTVTAIENDMVVIDVGLKSEGRVALREFAAPGQKAEIQVGDEVEVYVDRVENVHGEAMLSRDRARREAAWDKLEAEFTQSARVDGVIFGRVKGGFTVDLGGAVAFLPGSQVDIRPVRDVGPLMNVEQPFAILKMDRARGNIVVSRRAVLEETRASERAAEVNTWMSPAWKRAATKPGGAPARKSLKKWGQTGRGSICSVAPSQRANGYGGAGMNGAACASNAIAAWPSYDCREGAMPASAAAASNSRPAEEARGALTPRSIWRTRRSSRCVCSRRPISKPST